MSVQEKLQNSDTTPNFVGFEGEPVEDEAITRPDDAEFTLYYDTFYASSLEIYTDTGQSGTKLDAGTDYELVNKHDRLSEEAGQDVYTSLRIANLDYVDQELYYNYTTLGDFTDFEDLQFLFDKIEGVLNNYVAENDMDLNGYSIQNVESIQQTEVYGIEWDKEADEITRIGQSESLTRADFDIISPWQDMRRCNLADDGTVNAYYGDVDYTEDGSNGQVMVEIPKFWYKSEITKNGYRWYISPKPREDFELHPAFSRAGEVKDYIYIGAFEATLYDSSAGLYTGYGVTYDYANDMLASVAGYQPISGDTDHLDIGEARQMAENRGTGWTQQDFLTISAIQLLYSIEYADFDIQSTISEGITNLDRGDSNHSQNTGHTSSLGNSSGEVVISSLENGATGATETYAMSYRGIENLFGNIWKFTDGLIIKDDGYYYEDDPANFNDTADGYKEVALSVLTDNDGYIDDIEYDSELDFGFLGVSSSGDSSTHLHDYTWSHDSGEVNIARLGGHWSDGSRAGCFIWFLSDVASHSHRDHGARLALIP